MKKIIIGILFVSLYFILDGKFFTSHAYAQEAPVGADARVGNFYTALQPYGEWILDDTYGWVWSPYNIPINWRPYTDGHWVDTDQGWTWVSDQPWGWACFHYGRWFYEKNHGWLWYPDTVWAPAWVIWRTSEDMIGWASLPPRAVWRREGGLEFSDMDAQRVSWHAYNFCYAHDFTADDLANHFIQHARNVTIIKEAGIVPNSIRMINNRVVNNVPFQDVIVRALGHPVLRLKATDVEALEHRNVNAAVKSEPAELVQLHQSEMSALQNMHISRQRALEDEHVREINNPPPGKTKEQLLQQHKTENDAMLEQMERERQLLQSQHAREMRVATTSKVSSQRHISVPGFQPSSETRRVADGREENGRQR